CLVIGSSASAGIKLDASGHAAQRFVSTNCALAMRVASGSTQRQHDSALTRRSTEATAHLRVVATPPLIHDVRGAVTIGRNTGTTDADLELADIRISRRHARVERHPLGWRLVDLGSTNGGYLDGTAFTSSSSVSLNDGSVIRLGDSLLVFRTGGVPPPAIATA